MPLSCQDMPKPLQSMLKSQVGLASCRSQLWLCWADLHKHVALLQSLNAAMAHDGGDVVVAVCQAVQGEGCVVLQVAVARGHEGEQRL